MEFINKIVLAVKSEIPLLQENLSWQSVHIAVRCCQNETFPDIFQQSTQLLNPVSALYVKDPLRPSGV